MYRNKEANPMVESRLGFTEKFFVLLLIITINDAFDLVP
jgi:hypothetical protein